MARTKTKMATPAIVPVLNFRGDGATIDWLCDAFGFERGMVVEGDDGFVHHAELTLGGAMVMGGSERGEQRSAYAKIAHPAGTAMLYVALDEDLRLHCERARRAGAEIVMELTDKEYGSDYTARDPEGNLWTFGRYVPEVPA